MAGFLHASGYFLDVCRLDRDEHNGLVDSGSVSHCCNPFGDFCYAVSLYGSALRSGIDSFSAADRHFLIFVVSFDPVFSLGRTANCNGRVPNGRWTARHLVLV